ncbi:MAG: GNAT family N-acetyltransferase [Clostridia bacterium]|nr:GNAT family N-acetyltransferase [Clostridia bacterium]
MTVLLHDRTEATVRMYYEKSQQPEIKTMLPQKAKSAEEAVLDYYKMLLPGSTSYGRTIFVDGVYIGDVWCYCIDKTDTPNAMLSFCIFEITYWRKGIASEAVSLFLKAIHEKFGIGTIGAFTFSNNIASQRVLEKNGFQFLEEFIEDGRASKYYQLSL